MAQVSDFNIANASGAQVRQDINNVLEAIKTCNSGSGDPSNTEAFMFYGDSTDNILKIRNANNNGFTEIGNVNLPNLGLLTSTGGTMTGQLLGDDGSVAGSPAYAFDNDLDTGMFRLSANTIGFSTAGTARVSISNAGLDMTNALPIRFQDSSGSPFVALKAPASVSSNVTFTLPAADGSNGQMLQTNGSGALSFTTVQGVPSGAVFCIAVASVPSGYLECNGAAVSRTTYAALFAVIGTAYGTGNGSSTFNLPDLRGEFIRGFDNGRGIDSGRSIASSQSEQNKQHNHSASSSSSVSPSSHGHSSSKLDNNRVFGFKQTGANIDGETSPFGSPGTIPGFDISNLVNNTTLTVSTSTSIGNEGSENRPRNIAMMYVIKV
tara:strand:+ start:2750 stop:3886 length:1137 start_codon:yes stop_codon:yes gene_type:complete